MQIIKLSDGSLTKTFNVPKIYSPKVSESYFIFYCEYPSMRGLDGNAVPQTLGQVLVTVKMNQKRTRTEFMLSQADGRASPDGTTLPYLVGKESGLEIYKSRISEYRTETITVFQDERKNWVGVSDRGESSSKYLGDRRLNDNLELTYQFDKKISADLKKIDSAVTSLVESFITKNKGE